MFSIGRFAGSNNSGCEGSNDRDGEYRDGEDVSKTQGYYNNRDSESRAHSMIDGHGNLQV